MRCGQHPRVHRRGHRLRPHAQRTAISTAPLADAAADISAADLVVNATSLGLAPGDPLPIPADWLRPGQAVYDIVTHDSTPLSRAAEERGCTAATGRSMLLWQGVYAYERWFGHAPDAAAMRRALYAAP